MKKLSLGIVFIILFLVTSCVTTVPLNTEFYGKTKVGILIQMEEKPEVIKATTDGLVTTITDSDNKFYVGVEKIKSNITFKELLKKEISNTLSSKNKSFEMISDNFNELTLSKFKAPESDTEYSKYDFRFMKKKYNVNEILFVKVNHYGLLLVYSGVIRATKKGYVLMHSQVIDLKDNSLLQQKQSETTTKINGDWDKNGEYTNLQNAIQLAIDQSILKLKKRL
jgi:ASC-1-like (ASCH) protein